MAQFYALETVIRRAPLGLRFVDLVQAATVSDGLEVATWPAGATRGVIPAARSPVSGAFGFRSLPGLLAYEVGERPASDWCVVGLSPSEPTPEELLDLNNLRSLLEEEAGGPTANFVVYVADRLGRYLPQVLPLCLPRESLLEVPLFSAPARRPPPGLGVVRGELRERGSDTPAGWALVAASPDGVRTYVGIADARGMFTLFIPYAGALPPLVGSPPHGATDIGQLAWPLTLRVFYQPSHLRRVALPQEVAPPGGQGPPETRSILEQTAAQVYASPGVPASSIVQPLRFGQDLIVRTGDGPRLLVDAA